MVVSQQNRKGGIYTLFPNKISRGVCMKICFRQTTYDSQIIDEKELQRNSILADLEKTRRALENAYAGFDNVTDPDLIDCYIYEVNSVLKRYKFLLEQAAKVNLLPEEKLHTESPVRALIS